MLFAIAPLSARATLPGPLVDGEWLVENRDEVHVLDVRKDITSFEAAHIPGSIPVDVSQIRIEREIDGKTMTRMRPDPASFERFMRAHGVAADSRVVITHAGEHPGQLAGAARLYWQFKYYGFDQVALLDGGNRAWVDALEELTDNADPVTPGDYRAGGEDRAILADMAQVRKALGDDGITLIDTRELRYHVGLEQKDYVFARGHIPGSRSMPYKFLVPAKGGTRFFDRDYYLELLEAMRIDPDDELIVYCNSAYEASTNWFVLHEILGMEKVRIYDASLHQWTQYPSNPMTTRLTD